MRHTKNFHPVTDNKLLSRGDRSVQLAVATFIVLEDVRRHFGKPVTITSAVRLYKHNREVGGGENSYHLPAQGTCAVDFVVVGVEPAEVQAYLKRTPYASLLGIGSYRTFTHVDTRGYRARW